MGVVILAGHHVVKMDHMTKAVGFHMAKTGAEGTHNTVDSEEWQQLVHCHAGIEGIRNLGGHSFAVPDAASFLPY
jgi:trehalose/maltose hydrolase-like predicted phosphorylase